MKILWLNWKDTMHPTAGGAEVVLWELCQRLVRDRHEVTLLTCGYPGGSAQEVRDGITIIRIGRNRYLHSVQALAYYVRRLRGRFDIVIEVVNTAPYFSVLFGGEQRRFLFYHQLAREVWSYELKPPLSYIGRYLMEPAATRMLARARVPVITISESTRQDLRHSGFAPEHTTVITQGIQLRPVPDPSQVKKFERPTLLSFGALRAMKRTLHQVRAFEIAKRSVPNLQMKIAGSASDAYGKSVLQAVSRSPFADDIEYLGRITDDEKTELMRRCHAIAVTSVKEGWGLIVSEAASQGTPAIVYDVDGLRDSVRSGESGIVTEPNPEALAKGIGELLASPAHYRQLQHAGWQWAKRLTFDNTYRDFKTIVGAA